MAACRKYRKYIGAHVDGTASETEMSRLAAHLRECPHCARLIEELRRVRGMIRDLPTLSPPPGLMQAALLRVRAQRITCWDRLFGGVRLGDMRLTAGAAVALVVCVGLAVIAFHGVHSPIGSEGTVALVTSPHMPLASVTDAAPTDEYLQACSLAHGTLDQDQAFWSAEAVQLASYVRQ